MVVLEEFTSARGPKESRDGVIEMGGSARWKGSLKWEGVPGGRGGRERGE
jgi:hypothetical protein